MHIHTNATHRSMCVSCVYLVTFLFWDFFCVWEAEDMKKEEFPDILMSGIQYHYSWYGNLIFFSPAHWVRGISLKINRFLMEIVKVVMDSNSCYGACNFSIAINVIWSQNLSFILLKCSEDIWQLLPWNIALSQKLIFCNIPQYIMTSMFNELYHIYKKHLQGNMLWNVLNNYVTDLKHQQGSVKHIHWQYVMLILYILCKPYFFCQG